MLDQLHAYLQVVSSVFFGIFLEALPFLVIGVLVSGLLHVWVSDRLLLRWLPSRQVPAALLGSVMGLVLPVCECGVIAVSRRLVERGAPLPLAVAFMMAGPVVNPIVIGSTWVAFGGDAVIVLGRLGLVLAVAVAVALLIGLHRTPGALLLPRPAAPCQCPDHTAGDRRAIRALAAATSELLTMSKYLVVAALAAALFQAIVPRAALTALADNAALSVASMMLLAVLLSVCSTVDAFVALPFAAALGPAPVVAFLAFGPIANFKSTLLYLNVLRPLVIALILVLCFQLVFLGASALSAVFG